VAKPSSNPQVKLPIQTLSQANTLRDQRYRRSQKLRLRTADDIRGFVNDVGLCLLFPVNNIEIPNVYQAVCGAPKDTDTTLRDANIGLTWNTKDGALDKRWWYYGKLIKSKATLVSLDLFPNFYALSDNFGDPDDYLAEYVAGTLSADAKNIYEALLREGPTHAIQLKRKVNLYGDEVKTKFDKAVQELQNSLKILPVGVAEAGAWRYAFIYDLLWRWLPDVPAAAQKLGRAEARVNILSRHLNNVVYATPKELARTFGWRANEVQAAVEQLVARGEVAAGVTLKGASVEVVLALRPAVQ
jgi:hypothetical protein